MKKPVVKLNPQESDGVTRRGRGTRDKPKFKAGQVVAIIGSERENGVDSPAWFGIVQWEQDGHLQVDFPDGDKLEYTIGQVRPLTKRERG